jgi:hypothetical protein
MLHKEFDKLGQRNDMKKRVTLTRSYFSSLVNWAREYIYKFGYFISAAGIERMLHPLSVVPTVV